MVMTMADPNQIALQALGGQTPANNAIAPTVGSMLGAFGGNAPAPVPQPEQPEFNIEALRKVNHPVLQKMVVEMLMQRELQREQMRMRWQRGQQFGVAPGYWSELGPEERRADAQRIAQGGGYGGRGGSASDPLTRLAKVQTILNNATELVETTRTDPGTSEIVKTKQRQVKPGQARLLSTGQAIANGLMEELGFSTPDYGKEADEIGKSAKATHEKMQLMTSFAKMAMGLSKEERQQAKAVYDALPNKYQAMQRILAAMARVKAEAPPQPQVAQPTRAAPSTTSPIMRRFRPGAAW